MPRSRPASPAHRLVPALIALLACLPSGAAAQEGAAVEALSLDDAVRLARENNPGFGIQASSLETLAWRRRSSWGSFVPQAAFSNFFGYTADGARQFGDFTLGTRPAQLASVYNLGLSLSLTGAAFLERRVVSAQEVATRAQVDGAAAALVDEVTRAYLAVLQADEELEQALVEVERTEAYVGEAEAQVAVGAATPLDIRRAETQEGQARIQLVQAENAVATTRLALGQILGTEVSPEAALTTGFPIFEPGLDAAELIALALAGNPVLRATRSEAAAARTQTGMARAQYLPSVSLSASWTGSVFQADGIDPLVTNALAQVSGRYQGCLQDNRISALLGDPARDCGPLDVSNPAVAASVRSRDRAGQLGVPLQLRAPAAVAVGQRLDPALHGVLAAAPDRGSPRGRGERRPAGRGGGTPAAGRGGDGAPGGRDRLPDRGAAGGESARTRRRSSGWRRSGSASVWPPRSRSWMPRRTSRRRRGTRFRRSTSSTSRSRRWNRWSEHR